MRSPDCNIEVLPLKISKNESPVALLTLGFCGYLANLIIARRNDHPFACQPRWVPGIVQWQSGNRSGFRWVVPDVNPGQPRLIHEWLGAAFSIPTFLDFFGSQRSCDRWFFLRTNFWGTISSCVLRGGFKKNGLHQILPVGFEHLEWQGKVPPGLGDN